MRKLLITSSCIIGSLVAIAGAGKVVIPSRANPPIFSDLSDEEASQAVDGIVGGQRSLEQDLVSQLRARNMPDTRRVYVVYVLGQLRAQSAVAPLVEIVDFKAPFVDQKLDIGRWGQYPAAEALAAIGMPAMPKILEALRSETDALRVRLFLTTIEQIEGKKIGRARLQLALAEAAGKATEPRWQNALREYDVLVAHIPE